jgi:hypothetical protein
MLPLGGKHGKHAVQRGIWVPTQHLVATRVLELVGKARDKRGPLSEHMRCCGPHPLNTMHPALHGTVKSWSRDGGAAASILTSNTLPLSMASRILRS